MIFGPDTWRAIATVVIAVFTAFLAIFGYVQARLTYKTIGLAREEFLSTHRPKIIIHSVELAAGMCRSRSEIPV